MKIREEMSGNSQPRQKTRLSLYKDEEAPLHTAEVFHNFQCRPVV
jgi:hypothetical protein